MEQMGKSFLLVSTNQTKMLPREMIRLEKDNFLAQMMSRLSNEFIAGSKVIVFPGPSNKTTAQGVVNLFDSQSGKLLAIIEAKSITQFRTAACSVLLQIYWQTKVSKA